MFIKKDNCVTEGKYVYAKLHLKNEQMIVPDNYKSSKLVLYEFIEMQKDVEMTMQCQIQENIAADKQDKELITKGVSDKRSAKKTKQGNAPYRQASDPY